MTLVILLKVRKKRYRTIVSCSKFINKKKHNTTPKIMQSRFLLFLKITKNFHTFTTMKTGKVTYNCNYRFVANHYRVSGLNLKNISGILSYNYAADSFFISFLKE